jgi:hypothetical protein
MLTVLNGAAISGNVVISNGQLIVGGTAGGGGTQISCSTAGIMDTGVRSESGSGIITRI